MCCYCYITLLSILPQDWTGKCCIQPLFRQSLLPQKILIWISMLSAWFLKYREIFCLVPVSILEPSMFYLCDLYLIEPSYGFVPYKWEFFIRAISFGSTISLLQILYWYLGLRWSERNRLLADVVRWSQKYSIMRTGVVCEPWGNGKSATSL
jgi:hypothetical protein